MKRLFSVFIFTCLLAVQMRADGFNSIARSNASLRKADKAMKDKDFRIAAKSYEEALKEEPELPAQTRLNLGHAYFHLGNKALAQKNYLAALASMNSPALKSNACLQMGNLFSKEKNYKTALEWYQKSLLHQPENKKARLNYELAWKLNQQKEEEQKKQNPERNPQQDKQQNQQEQQKQNQQNQEQQASGQKPSGGEQNQKGKDNQPGKQENQNKGQGQKEKEDSQGKEQKDKPSGDAEKNPGKEKEESPDQEGTDSRQKKQESNADDPDAYRMDKQKLRESGLNEEQAKNMLQAMRQTEIKYLQQRRFKGKSGNRDKTGPRW